MGMPSRGAFVLTFFGGATSLAGCFNPSGAGGEDGSTGDDATSAGPTTAPSTSASTSGTSNTTSPSTTTPPTTDVTTQTDATGEQSSSGNETGPQEGSSSGSTGCPPEGTGSGGEDVDPPQYIGAEFTEADVVTVTFSEGVANPADVDPAQFRLSYGIASAFPPAPYDTLIYYDLGYLDGVAIAVEDIGWRSCARDQLVLYLDGQLTQEVCDRVEAFNDYYFGGSGPGYESAGAILLHFSNSTGNYITDEAGNVFAEISPGFVDSGVPSYSPNNYYVYADFPDREPDLPIPCPF